MTRVLLTGASGFIGSYAAVELEARGYEVHAVTTRALSPVVRGVAKWHQADLLDPLMSTLLVEEIRPSHLLHFAWYVKPGRFWDATENVHWLEASLRLVRAFTDGGGRRAVVAGTCAEYDWVRSGHCIEAISPLLPATLYGLCKDSLRSVGSAWCERAGVEFAWGRIFFPYGPGEPGERLVSAIAQAVLSGRPAPCSHGRQLRDFIYVSDVAAAFAALVDARVTGAVNIASGKATTISEVALLVGDVAGDRSLVKVGNLPDRPGDPSELTADIGVLQNEVGFTPQVALREGIDQTVAWWRAARNRG